MKEPGKIVQSRLANLAGFTVFFISLVACNNLIEKDEDIIPRQRISINQGWKFYKYNSTDKADDLIYDIRPAIEDHSELRVADSEPTEAVGLEQSKNVLKPYILPIANVFIKSKSQHYEPPKQAFTTDFPFVLNDLYDQDWESVDLPHDWAIQGPFFEGDDPEVGGGMGRLPSNGVAWYRKKLDISLADKEKSIFLDVDGAMSYAMVWLNGHLIGGWPYGYNSWRLDLTPFVDFDGNNQLAIRLDNPNHSARWYPGGGLYRNVWLVKTNKIHVAHWGTFFTSRDVSEKSAVVDFEVTVDNDFTEEAEVDVFTEIYLLDNDGKKVQKPVAVLPKKSIRIEGGESQAIKGSTIIENPNLWGPPPSQTPNLYKAITTTQFDGEKVDIYETTFGIRSLEFDSNQGILINGELVKIKGVNEHHDLGALGAAFNVRAAERKLEILREMGCNAIRMAHNPPAPELLELTDKMGFLVMDEVFDSWERKKTPHDFHLIFEDWHEADARSMVRRDKNHPSVIMWSYGNEVGEQYTGEDGAAVGRRLVEIIKDEDPTRPTTSAMNWAKPDMPFPALMDVISLNYQGEGIRQDPVFDEIKDRIKTKPQYEPFHNEFPNKVILSSETASAASSRGVYLFPVTDEISSPIRDSMGGSSEIHQVSSYELYAVDFGSSADKVFASLDKHPYSAGEFVWTGFDYLGEPTPYYECRSSYNGIIDLAGFPKDRYFLYQSRWRPDYPMVHILPHWNWPDRIGEVTPVHVFTSGDEVELFLNGRSLGKKKKAQYEYRLRWDDVVYEAGELKAVAYKNGNPWAEKSVTTTGAPARLLITADREQINPDGMDLTFITVMVTDENGFFVANASNEIEFTVAGAGELVATDNGDPCDMTAFPSNIRKAFNGLALGIIRSIKGQEGSIDITVISPGLQGDSIKTVSKLSH